MGGGVGSRRMPRIVRDRAPCVAMPEVGIGFFPDVGALLLARAPGELGTHLALTGDRIGAADAIHCGLADIYVPGRGSPEFLRRSPVAARRADVSRPARGHVSCSSATQPRGRKWIDRATPPMRSKNFHPAARVQHDDARAAFATMQRIRRPRSR